MEDKPKTITKHCIKHGETTFRLSGKHYRCSLCKQGSKRRGRQNNKKRLIAVFGSRCLTCGYGNHASTLQFHHLDPKSKCFGIADNTVSCYSRLLEEAKKCVLVCANCHSEIETGVRIVSQETEIRKVIDINFTRFYEFIETKEREAGQALLRNDLLTASQNLTILANVLIAAATKMKKSADALSLQAVEQELAELSRPTEVKEVT